MTNPFQGNNFIDGQWIPAARGETFERRNPADPTDVVGIFPDSDATDVTRAVDALAKAASAWAATSPEKRGEILEAAAAVLDSRRDQLIAELIREEGKTHAEAMAEVGRTPHNLRFYAGEAVRATGSTYPSPGNGLVMTLREPIGIVGAITPWNFPLNIPSRKIGPALAAGNCVLYKPSEITPLMGQRLVEALLEAGLPAGVIALVQGSGRAGAAVAADHRVTAVTFTGSTAVGRKIHAAVGADRRVQLEMGGKNPAVVLADADLDAAARHIVKGAFGLSGQACTGTSRVVVDSAVHDVLLDKVSALVADANPGPGHLDGVTMGPLASKAQYDKFLEYVELGIAEGARLVTGGTACDTDGFFVSPAVFADTTRTMRIVTDEVFGPLIAFQRVGSFDEAVEVANDTEYGLSASVMTTNLSFAVRFVNESKSGLVKINQPTTGMAMNAPFGGYKSSSTQSFKEQAGPTLMRFYQSEKTVYLDPSA